MMLNENLLTISSNDFSIILIRNDRVDEDNRTFFHFRNDTVNLRYTIVITNLQYNTCEKACCRGQQSYFNTTGYQSRRNVSCSFNRIKCLNHSYNSTEEPKHRCNSNKQ